MTTWGSPVFNTDKTQKQTKQQEHKNNKNKQKKTTPQGKTSQQMAVDKWDLQLSILAVFSIFIVFSQWFQQKI